MVWHAQQGPTDKWKLDAPVEDGHVLRITRELAEKPEEEIEVGASCFQVRQAGTLTSTPADQPCDTVETAPDVPVRHQNGQDDPCGWR